MNDIKTLIIDDDINIINTLQHLISRFFPDIKTLDSCEESEAAYSTINEKKPDLVFLHVGMPSLMGFDLLHKYKHRKFEVIFISASEGYALKAFNENALGYLLKPIDRELFIKTVTNAIIRIKEKRLANLESFVSKMEKNPGKSRKIAVPFQGGFKFLNRKDVIYAQANGSYTNIISKEGTYTISKNLKQFMSGIENWNFIKVNRSCSINPDQVVSYSKKDGGEIFLTDDSVIQISAKNKNEVFENIERTLLVI